MNEPRYSVKAIRDVVIRAFVTTQRASSADGTTVSTAYTHEEWLVMIAGEERNGLAEVVGVLPSCAPEHRTVHLNGVDVVVQERYENSDLPKDLFGLYRLSID